MIVSMETAAIMLNTSEQNLYVARNTYEKKYGKNPPWFISGRGKAHKCGIDIDAIDNENYKKSKLINKAHSLFYVAEELGISQSEIARYAASMTGESYQSWYNYLSIHLWTYAQTEELFPRKSSKLNTFIQMIEEVIYREDPTFVGVA
jgi:hypothetical protein